MELIKNILENSKKEKKFIGIWLYNDEDGFWSGYVEDFNDEFVIIQHYTKYGKPDGLIIEKIENIESIEFDNDYSKAMEYLVANNEKIDALVEIKLQINDLENWQFEVLEQQVANENRIVRLQINDNYPTGMVLFLDEENVILKMIGKEGENEGKSIFKIEDIETIRINDMEGRKRLLLNKWRNANK